MRKLFLILAAALAMPLCSTAQEKAIKPLNVPMSFAGNYGELRRNHFHGGLDWRVGGKVGDPIHAIKSGYISRVSVSPTGYGNAVYITHGDGTTSVYGHMLSFRDDIARRVKAEQYHNESFSINLYLGPDEFPLKQGEVFGKVGNTGSSAGPHLHMEVRDTEEEIPLNYLTLGYYSPEDNLAPHFRRIQFFAIDSASIPYVHKLQSINNPLAYRKTISLPPLSYVAIDAYDIQNGTTGKLAVETYRVSLDGELIFEFKVGDVGFTEGRYISSLVQQGEKGADLVKTYVEPGNALLQKASYDNQGLIELPDYKDHNLRIEALDGFGNRSLLRLTVRRDDSLTPSVPPRDTTAHYAEWLWNMPGIIDCEDFSYTLPVGALCTSANVSYKIVAPADSLSGRLSPVWRIDSPRVALQKSGTLSFKADVPDELQGKTFIASYSSSGGRLSYAGSRVGFGTYCLAYDVTAPKIGVDRHGRYTVSDDRSGVSSVRVEIDGEWHLFKFYRGVVTILDRESISRGKHYLRITATDHCGNSSELVRSVKF